MGATVVYPRFGQVIRKQFPKGRCKVCGDIKANAFVEIQYSYMRGDDDVISIHENCFNRADGDTRKRLLEGK